jgi:hypothetical protein
MHAYGGFNHLNQKELTDQVKASRGRNASVPIRLPLNKSSMVIETNHQRRPLKNAMKATARLPSVEFAHEIQPILAAQYFRKRSA